MLSGKKQKTARPGSGDVYMNHIADELKSVLGSHVKIVDKKGKGKIVIEYYSKMELERLIEILTK
jgi:ParB family chromosome partitioning protein